MATKALSYFRTSSATNTHGDSLDRQRAAVTAYALANSIEIVGEYYDAAVSEADPIDQRPDFLDMLARIQSNGVRTILVENASRFARDLIVQETGYAMLVKLGISLVAVDDPDAFTGDTPTSKMVRQILGAVSEFEKANLVAKLRGARDRRSKADGQRIEGRKGYDVTKPAMVAEATPEGATGIVQRGQLRRAGEPRVYMRTAPKDTGYGTHRVAVDVDPRQLRLDDEFGDGRTDFAIDQPRANVGNPRIVNRSAAEPRANTQWDPGYLYHATNTDNAAGIAEDGKMVTHRPDFGTDQDRWPDGGTGKRRYFTPKASRAYRFAPAEGQSVILRVPDSATKFRTERGTGDVFTNKRIPRDQLEILGGDQNWHRLNSFYAQPQRFRGMTRDQLERQPIDDLDRAAYGVAGGDTVQLQPNQIQIDHLDDLANAQDKFDKGGMAWAQRVDQSEPVQVRMQQDGQFHLEDGHHRWLAARKTGQPLQAEVTVKGKPIETILRRQKPPGASR